MLESLKVTEILRKEFSYNSEVPTGAMRLLVDGQYLEALGELLQQPEYQGLRMEILAEPGQQFLHGNFISVVIDKEKNKGYKYIQIRTTKETGEKHNDTDALYIIFSKIDAKLKRK
ncbi:MAG TPA: hypothetical protein VG895_01790 [Patescibacteria group bacterium]|nr:hypothetical protein [Patescibacteria group bacterium]